jgi:hypothetical protein
MAKSSRDWGFVIYDDLGKPCLTLGYSDKKMRRPAMLKFALTKVAASAKIVNRQLRCCEVRQLSAGSKQSIWHRRLFVGFLGPKDRD